MKLCPHPNDSPGARVQDKFKCEYTPVSETHARSEICVRKGLPRTILRGASWRATFAWGLRGDCVGTTRLQREFVWGRSTANPYQTQHASERPIFSKLMALRCRITPYNRLLCRLANCVPIDIQVNQSRSRSVSPHYVIVPISRFSERGYGKMCGD